MNESGDFFFEKFGDVLFPVKKESNWALFAFRKIGNNQVNFHLFDPCNKGEGFWESTKKEIFRIWKVVCFKQNASLRASVNFNTRKANNLMVQGGVDDCMSGFVIPVIAKYFVEKKDLPNTLQVEDMRKFVVQKILEFEIEREWRKNLEFKVLWKHLLLWDENSCFMDVIIVPLFLFCQNQIESVKDNSAIKKISEFHFQVDGKNKGTERRED